MVESRIKANNGAKAWKMPNRLTQEDKSIYVVDVPNASLRSDVLHFDANGAQELGNKMFQFIEKKKLLK